MSRIAGLVVENSKDKSSEIFLNMMLDYMKGDDRWAISSETLGCSALGAAALCRKDISKSDNLVAVVDGLFYNKEELPNGSNLADIVISLYRTYGFERTLQKINGDFSIALYDAQRNITYLGRDRIGLRPLYYAQTKYAFGFASRPLSLSFIPDLDIVPNAVFTGLFAGSHYRTIDNDRNASPYENISQLPAACYLTYENKKIEVKSYWSLQDSDNLAASDEELAEKYRHLLIDSVGRRFDQVKNPAFTLSGGMDSSSVLSCAVEHTGEKQIAYSSVYKDPTYDETDEIKCMIGDKVSTWNTVSIDEPDTFSLIREMVSLHDEPVATATWLSHYILAQRVKDNGYDALFGGLGGDEMNGGEYEYFFCLFADLKYENKEDDLKREIEKWVEYHDHPIFKKDFDVAKLGWEKLANMSNKGQCLADRTRIEKYADTVNKDFYDVKSFNPVMDKVFDNYLKNRTYHDIFRETAPCCIRAEDRQTVPFAIDNILPFFDYRIVEFMFNVSNNHKIRDGITKRLLREAMKGILPEETRGRIKKTGWNAPAHIWFSGKGMEELRDIVSSQSFRNRNIYNVEKVEKLFKEHENIVSNNLAQENHMMFFWQLANVTIWLDHIDEIKSRKLDTRKTANV